MTTMNHTPDSRSFPAAQMRVKWDHRHMRTAAAETWLIMAWMGGVLITGLGIISTLGGVPWGAPVLAAVIWFPSITGLYLVFEKLDRTTRRDR